MQGVEGHSKRVRRLRCGTGSLNEATFKGRAREGWPAGGQACLWWQPENQAAPPVALPSRILQQAPATIE